MSILHKAIHFSHDLLQKCVRTGDTVVDATMGNGSDTLFLAELVGETGTVHAFDIQEQALLNTKNKLIENNLLNQVQLNLLGHEKIDLIIEKKQLLSAAIFNLGYLPKGDKRVVTREDTTLQAINHLLPRMKSNGLIILVVYYGHEGGQEEKEALLTFSETLSQKEVNVLRYQFINQKNQPPFVLAIEKK